LKKKLYIGEGQGLTELESAWYNVFQNKISKEDREFYSRQDKGIIFEIGQNSDRQTVYWVAVGKSKEICKQSWADLWDLLDDSIVNWDLVE
jgi:hypothetical protein